MSAMDLADLRKHILESDTPALFEFPRLGNSQLGYLTTLEEGLSVPFEIQRVYWTYYTPNEVLRGGHAHYELQQLIFSVNGVIDIATEDMGGHKRAFRLDSPSTGLYIPRMVWRDIRFSHSAVLLCIASLPYDEADYMRDYKLFKEESARLASL